MFEAGLWLAGFGFLFVITWSAGQYFSERNAIRRVMRRRGNKYARLLEEKNDSTLYPRFTRINRRSTRAVSEHAPEKLKQAS